MVLDQGVLKPGGAIAGRQVRPVRPSRGKEGLNINQMQRLLRTGKPNICIVRSLGGIGDVLMTTPMLAALKHKWPDCHLTYATDFKYMDGALRDVLLYNPHIDELIQYQTALTKEYDFKADVTSVCVGREKPGVKVSNRVDLFAEYLDVSLDATGHVPTYVVSDQEKAWAKKKLERYPRQRANSPRIGIQVRSSTTSRSWPIENVRALAMKLVQEIGAQVIILDSSHGHGPTDEWNMPGLIAFKDYKIRQVAAIINEMDLMITPDSSLLHISGALNKKTVSIWAGSDPSARINYYPNAIAIVKSNYACFPCWYDPRACAKSYLCIKSITVDEVFDATRNLIEVDTQTLPFTRTVARPSEFDYCIIRDDGIGDITACLPAFSAFKKKYPDKKIMFATMAKNTEFIKLSKCFHGVMSLSSKWEAVEHPHIFDGRDLFEKQKMSKGEYGNYFEDRSRLSVMSEFLDVEPDVDYRLPRSNEYIDRFYDMLSDHGVDSNRDMLITLQFGATCTARTWNQNHIQPLLRKLYEIGYTCVMLGQPRDPIYDTYRCVNLSGQLSVMMFNAAVAASDIFVGVDSGGVHLAAYNNTPFVAIFNAIEPQLRLCDYNNYRVVFPRSLDCAPCCDKGCQEMKCMEMMDSQIVYDAIRDLSGSFFQKTHKEVSI